MGLPYTFATQPSGNVPASYLDSNFSYLENQQLTPLRSYLAGLQLSNDATSPNTVLDIAAGQCADIANAVYINLGAFSKSTGGVWSPGSGANGMGNGLTIADSTWYHVFAIMNGGNADVYFDTSVSAANAPSGTTAFRRIGSFKTNASAQILGFTQNGDQFIWALPTLDYNAAVPTTKTSSVLNVPSGVVVEARTRAVLGPVAGQEPFGSALLFSLLEVSGTDGTPNGNSSINYNYGGADGTGSFDILTNTAQQIGIVGSVDTLSLTLVTYGWRDTRGRDA